MRLVVSEVRDGDGRLLATWLLLTNVPASVPASEVALWYYWRWRVEMFHPDYPSSDSLYRASRAA